MSNNNSLTTAQPSELRLSVPEADIERLDALSIECAKVERAELAPFMRTYKMAAGMRQLRDLISDEMMKDIMQLQGSPLGFRTDKDGTTDGHGKPGYPVAVVKEVAIEATLRGLRLVGNEINIIASRMYAAKDGLKRLVFEWPGISNVKTSIGVPRKAEGYTVVPCSASWMLSGEEFNLQCTGENSIPVRVNSDGKGGEQLVDAVIGKATRKLFARIYDRLLGRDAGLLEPDGTAAAAANPALPGPNEEEIKATVSEYTAKINATTTIQDIGGIIRDASKDKRLDDAGRKAVAEAGTMRRSVLQQQERQNRGRQNQPARPAEQKNLIDNSVDDHSQLVAEWSDQINQADNRDRLEEIQENAKQLQPPVRGFVERAIAEKMKKIGQ